MSMIKLFDSHCHLHLPQFDNDREEVIKKLLTSKIGVINVGTDFEDSKKAVELALKYPKIMRASVGLHPNDVLNSIFNYEAYKALAESGSVVAIGECGLDYFKVKKLVSDRTRSLEADYADRQKEIFIKQIELAKELNKPLILHCRPSVGSQDAYEDAIEILKYKSLNISNGNGVAHFFVGSEETAKKFLDLGFYISFAGPITFAPEYREVVEFVPINRILVETDAPFAAPVPHRGKRNEPSYVELVARQIIQWKNLNFEEVVRQTTENAKKLFNINS